MGDDPNTPDPVQIVAREISCGVEGCEGCARTGLEALTDAGWRIVRIEGNEYAGEDVQITEEWTP